jgi:hypothetical protein
MSEGYNALLVIRFHANFLLKLFFVVPYIHSVMRFEAGGLNDLNTGAALPMMQSYNSIDLCPQGR